MDIELNYEEKGSGEALILLHGNGEDHGYFSSQLEFFSKYYRTIALDTRGHGLTQRGEGVFSLTRFADDLYDFINEKAIRKANILGFSDGGNVALIFALKHMEKVDKLILNSANLYPKGMKRSVLKWVEEEYNAALEDGDEKRRELMALMLYEPDIKKEELKALHIPVLVVAGTRDMISLNHTKMIARNIPSASLCLLEGDHFIARNKSDEFDKVVLDFLLE